MSAPTLLIYVEKTGHVLAAATMTAPPAGNPAPETFVGTQLPVRYIGEPTSPPHNEVQVPVNQLAVLSVDSQLIPINSALEHFVKPDKSTSKLPSTKVGAISLGHDAIKINLTATSSDKVTIWVRIQPQASLDPGELAAKSRTAFMDYTPPDTTSAYDVPLQLDPLPDSGDYTTLVLVSGFQPSLKTTNLP